MPNWQIPPGCRGGLVTMDGQGVIGTPWEMLCLPTGEWSRFTKGHRHPQRRGGRGDGRVRSDATKRAANVGDQTRSRGA